MAHPPANATDIFATRTFAKKLFERIVRTRHVSLTAGRLFLTVETSGGVPESWFLALMCLYDIPSASLKGAGGIERVRMISANTYQLISEPLALAAVELIPLPKGSAVRLVTRGGDQKELRS